jgi:hypothetical protein
MMGDLAGAFHFQPSEIEALSLNDFMAWHRQAVRIHGKNSQT